MIAKPILKLSRYIEAVEQWHTTNVQCRFPALQRSSTYLIAIALSVSALAIALNGYVRQTQLDYWMALEDQTGLIGENFYTTADAPFFIAVADTLARRGTLQDYNATRHYPNRAEIKDQASENSFQRFRDAPLLSVFIATLAPDKSRASLLSTGLHLVTASALATAAFIIIAFAVAGYWLEGAIAALGGGLSTAYLVRSAAGRIDTDQLNLGFIYLLFGLNVVAAHAGSRKAFLAWCLGIGVVTHLFMWWYPKQELAWIVAASLAWLSLALRRNVVDCLLGVAVILLLSGTTFTNPLGNAYLIDTPQFSDFLFLNTLGTITETKQVSLPQVLIMAAGSIEMGFLCVAGLALWAIRHPVLAIGYGPLAIFGLLNFIIGNRAVFYSAPILWFGFAFLIFQLGTFIHSQISAVPEGAPKRKAPIMVSAFIAIAVVWVNSATSYVPRPVFDKEVLNGFIHLEKPEQTPPPIVATWWDYGYSSMFLNRLPTIHDGGSQNTPSTHFMARALLDSDLVDSLNTIKFLVSQPIRDIGEFSTLAEIETVIDSGKTNKTRDIYLVVTGQMAGWMGSISKIGNWDIEKGEAIQLRGNPDGAEVHYKPMNCRFNGYPQYLNCTGLKIDLERGLIDGQPLLVGWTHTQDGETLRGRSFDHDTDHAIQIVQDGGRISAYFLHRQLYESTFNKLYYQGLMEHPAISLHYDDYPHIRIYKVDGRPPAHANKS